MMGTKSTHGERETEVLIKDRKKIEDFTLDVYLRSTYLFIINFLSKP
jgi:hypothetical protein